MQPAGLPNLGEAQFDASLFESAGELLQLLQVVGLIRVRGDGGHRRHPAAAHLRTLVSLRWVTTVRIKDRNKKKEEEEKPIQKEEFWSEVFF